MSATVLVVDDEELILALVRETLGASSFEVLAAGDAARGLELARAHQPALALLDVNLGGVIDGLELCRKLRALDHPPRVLFLSGNSSSGDVDAGLAAGAEAYLTKPFSPLELIERVRSLT